MDVPQLSNHGPAETHLRRFHFGAIMNNAAVNIYCLGFCVNLSFHFSGIQAHSINKYLLSPYYVQALF